MVAPTIDIELCQAAADCYVPAGKFERTFEVSGVWYATRLSRAGERIIAFRGTNDPGDVFTDLRAWPVRDPQVGYCEAGFHEGMREALLEWRRWPQSAPAWITGHSLGAARASIAAAILSLLPRHMPLGLVVFGCPRPGFSKLRRIVGKLTVCRVYSNIDDPVPDVPVPIWHILPYRHPAKPIMLEAGKRAGDDGPFSAHHVSQYQRGLEML